MKFLFAAGGTGGHINPALAVAQYIRDKYPDSEIIFVGTSDRMEAQLVPSAGFELRTIKISGFQRGLSLSSIRFNIKTAYNILTSSKEAKKIIPLSISSVTIQCLEINLTEKVNLYSGNTHTHTHTHTHTLTKEITDSKK